MRILIILLCSILLSCTTIPKDVDNSNDDYDILTVPTVFVPSTVHDWAHFRYQILSTRAKHITVLWTGRGGWFDVGNPVRMALRQAELQGKVITFKLIGPAMSLHAYMACEASRIEWTPNAVLMFHVAADVMTGRISLLPQATDEVTDMLNVCYSKGILNSIDVYNVKSVHELWIYPDGSKNILPDRRSR
jgi:hypothetical protein